MIIIPAIDIIHGECVRLYQGEEKKKTVFSSNPYEVALKWQSMGAKIIHVVDLDGAFKGNPQNLFTILNLAQKIDIPIELGGGLRNKEIIDKILAGGIERVILGTIAYTDPILVEEICLKHKDRIIIGVDAQDGKLAIKGWKDIKEINAIEFCQKWSEKGIRAIIYTDIGRDGTLKGPNISATKSLLKNVSIPVIASGGVSTMADLEALSELEGDGLEGVIIGRALYTGAINLDEAISKWQTK